MCPKLHRYIDVAVPVKACNLRCHYCYITHNKLFNTKISDVAHSKENVGKSFSQRVLGGVCLINLCGEGETLLLDKMPDYIEAILSNGHFISLVTNGTVTKSLKRIAELPPEYLERLFIKFSFHYLELKKRGLLEQFCKNVRMLRDAGASFTVEVTPSDELVPYISDVIEISKREFGAVCHVTVARDERNKASIPILSKMSLDEYKRVWGVFNSPLFDFKISVFGIKQRSFCCAGEWTYFLSLETGLLFQCYGCGSLQNIYATPPKPLKPLPVGHFCPLPHCYNAHVFMSLGTIADVKAPTYDLLRNRVCGDGSEWLRPKMKAFLSQKLYDNNPPKSFFSRLASDVRFMCAACLGAFKRHCQKIFR